MKNIADILRNAPEGIELYSTAFGVCKLSYVIENEITIEYFDGKNPDFVTLDQDGKFMPNGSCILFPANSTDSWVYWQEHLFRKDESIGYVIIDTHLEGFWVIGEHDKSMCLYDCAGGYMPLRDCNLSNCRYATKEESVKFFEKVGEHNCHWDIEAKSILENTKKEEFIEEPKNNSKFKDGDIVTIINHNNGWADNLIGIVIGPYIFGSDLSKMSINKALRFEVRYATEQENNIFVKDFLSEWKEPKESLDIDEEPKNNSKFRDGDIVTVVKPNNGWTDYLIGIVIGPYIFGSDLSPINKALRFEIRYATEQEKHIFVREFLIKWKEPKESLDTYEEPKEFCDEDAKEAANIWCRCFKCDGIVNETGLKCSKTRLLTCSKWYDSYKASLIALETYKRKLKENKEPKEIYTDEEAEAFADKVSYEWWQMAMGKWNTLTEDEKKKYNQYIGFNDFSDYLMNILRSVLLGLKRNGKLIYEEGSLFSEPDQKPTEIEMNETTVPCYEPKDSYCNGNCVDCVYKTTKCWQTNEEGSLFSEPDQKPVEIELDETPNGVVCMPRVLDDQVQTITESIAPKVSINSRFAKVEPSDLTPIEEPKEELDETTVPCYEPKYFSCTGNCGYCVYHTTTDCSKKIEYDKSGCVSTDSSNCTNKYIPKLKVGDKACLSDKNDNIYFEEILKVNDEEYYTKTFGWINCKAIDELHEINFKEYNKPFTIDDFKPFDKVLWRLGPADTWSIGFFDNYYIAGENDKVNYSVVGYEKDWVPQCVPYNIDTAYLHDTDKEYDGKYKTW